MRSPVADPPTPRADVMASMLSPLSDKPPQPPEAKCPRCQKPLTDPKGLGWCQACGYCKSLEEDKARTPVPAPAERAVSRPNTVTATAGAVANLPLWVWVMLAGVAAIALGSYFASKNIQVTPMRRAVWATLQIAAGVGLLAITQFFALLMLAPGESSLGSKDLLMPAHLYGLVFRHLPRMAWAVCTLAWALVLIVSAVVLVGGLGHWLTLLEQNQRPRRTGTPNVWAVQPAVDSRS